MISEERILENKERFINLVKQINRAGIDKLLYKLENSDFYYAPASTKYHCSYKGGLVEHSLNVYDNLTNLVEMKNLKTIINPESILVISLFHDLSKMNFYRTTYKNVKQYSESGNKYDENGRFNWVSVQSYEVIPSSERFVYGNHEENSEFMVRQYIPISYEEAAAIIHHHGSVGFDSTQMNLSPIFERYPMATLLFMADYMSTFIDEKGNSNNE